MLPNVASQVAPRSTPPVAAQPRPGVLPFAGEAGHSVLGGVLGGLGLLSIGAALRLRGQRDAATNPPSRPAGVGGSADADSSPPSSEQTPGS